MVQVDNLSCSLPVFDQNTSLIVVVEMSDASWPIAGLAVRSRNIVGIRLGWLLCSTLIGSNI